MRNLEREIAAVSRKIAREVATRERRADTEPPPVAITPEKIARSPGPRRASTPRWPSGSSSPAWPPAWSGRRSAATSSSSRRHACRAPRQLTLTGQLGDVMRESAQAAHELGALATPSALGIPADFFNQSDIHLHVPAGAIPKDGPSAGITMTTALASLLTGRPVRDDVAMTGEITLRGRGAAGRRASRRRCWRPTAPASRRSSCRSATKPTWTTCRRSCASKYLQLVDTMDQVLQHALCEPSPDSMAAQEEMKQDIRRQPSPPKATAGRCVSR